MHKKKKSWKDENINWRRWTWKINNENCMQHTHIIIMCMYIRLHIKWSFAPLHGYYCSEHEHIENEIICYRFPVPAGTIMILRSHEDVFVRSCFFAVWFSCCPSYHKSRHLMDMTSRHIIIISYHIWWNIIDIACNVLLVLWMCIS